MEAVKSSIRIKSQFKITGYGLYLPPTVETAEELAPNINKTLSLANGSSIAQQSYHYAREVLETEVFPNKDPDLGSQITNLAILDIAYYPEERGPNNYTINGIDASGTLLNPSSNWAGMMRKLETNDFEAANIEFVEFWMMDPFNSEDGLINHSGGDMYLHLGNVSVQDLECKNYGQDIFQFKLLAIWP